LETGIELIADERSRQVSQEGWTPEHDDEHSTGELAQAALCYAKYAELQGRSSEQWFERDWPWDETWWKPSPDPIRNLVKAGALIAAEIDRLQRRQGRGGVNAT
jgi:hypothetical protein